MLYLTVRCSYKTMIIDLSITCQVVDQTDVLSFRSFNRTNSSVVSEVNITNLKGSSVT